VAARPRSRARKLPENSRNHLSERLNRFYLKRGYTFRKLGLLCGVSAMTAKRACDGEPLRRTTAYKFERMLREVHAQ